MQIKDKAIKKSYKILFYTLLVLILTPVILYALLLIPYIQNKAGNFITSNLSRNLGVEVSVGKVYFYPFKKLTIQDFLIRDQNNDTLIYSHKLNAHIDSIHLRNKLFYLGEVKAVELYSNLKIYKDSSNYQFIINSINKNKSNQSVWKTYINQFSLQNSKIKIAHQDHESTPGIFNSKDIDLSNVNLQVDKINQIDDSITFRIKKLSLKDKCDFQIKSMESFVAIGPKSTRLNNLKIRSLHSSLSVDLFRFNYDSDSVISNFQNEVPLELKINSFLIDVSDIRKFSDKVPDIKNRIYLNGYFKGTLNNLKGRNVKINAGTNTELLTNFDVKDIFNLKECYLFLDVKHLNTNIVDLAKLISLNEESNDFAFPASFQTMGDIKFKGIISGFIDNLVTFGSFDTDLGKIDTDLGFKFTEDQKFVYSGYLNTKSLNIGKLIKSEDNLSKITMDLSINGYRTKHKKFNSYISGTIDSIEYNNYKYKQLELNGLLSNNKFDGRLELNDPNARVHFEGKMDFTNNVPEFDFDASLQHVNLNELQLTEKLEGSYFNLNISSNINGKDLNSIYGDIKLYDGIFNSGDKIIPIDTFKITTTNLPDYSSLSINSDLLEAEIKGQYHLKTLFKTLKNELSRHIPSLIPLTNTDDNSPVDFDFHLQTKKFADLLHTINPDIEIADSTILKSNYNSVNHKFSLEIESQNLKLYDINSTNLDLSFKTNKDTAFTYFKSDETRFNNLVPVKNFTLSQEIQNDTVAMNIQWNNNQSKLNRGNIISKTSFKRDNKKEIFTKIALLPSEIIIGDSIWNIQGSGISLNPYGVNFDVVRIHHLNQEISINGSLYKNSDNNLNAYIQNIDLGKINEILNLESLTFNGLINGNIKISGDLKNPIVTNNLIVKDMSINQALIGDLELDSYWDKKENAILASAIAKHGQSTPLKGSGYYTPKENDFNLYLDLDSLPINFLDYYLDDVLQNINGTASGRIKLAFNEKEDFNITGRLNLNKTDFNIDLLQCSFSVKDSVFLTPDSMIFNNMTVTDSNGKSGIFNGVIQHNSFGDFKYDLYARANDMLVMNTTIADNPLYYGTIYATGDFGISGTNDNLLMEINGKTEKKTKFFIPITEKTESLDNNYIRFVQHNQHKKDASDQSANQDYEISLSNLAINMGLEVTPDAQVQVIFDPAVGDILRSWGSGNIQIQLTKEGDVIFYGYYTAEKVDYLFSLENVVNKRFDINKGGKVVWEGNPYDAILDLTATYKLKTSIQPLILPSSESSQDVSYRRIPIYCDMLLSGHLSQPNIKFDISAPTMDQSTQTLIDDAINTEEELNRQILSLLVLNKFYTPDYYANSSGERQVNNAALTNTSEMLSSQLSNWLSQISNDFDIGISYRPENEISSEQLEVALSTQIFNDRVTIDGNVEYGKYTTTDQNTNNIVGDFDLNVKLNKSGNLRAKAYTHTNDDYSYDSSPNTQGVGISYQEEFNTFGELVHKYWNWITGKGKKEKKVEPENETNEEEDN